MKIYFIRSKNGIMMNFGAIVKELDDWSSCKDDHMGNPSTCDSVCNKACKINGYLVIKNCSCEKSLISKLALGCEDEIVNTTETSPKDEKVRHEKRNCLIIGNNHFYYLLLLLYKRLD